MVRLGLTNNLGRTEDGRISSPPESEESYPHTGDEHIGQYTQSHHIDSSNPRSSSFFAEESHTEPSPSGSHYLPTNHGNEVLPASHGLLTVLNRNAQISHLPSAGWSQKTMRTRSNVHSRGSQKQSTPESSNSSSSSSADINYTRDVKFCPVCRSSVVSGSAHHCKLITEPSTLAYSSHTAPVNVSQHPPLPRPGEPQAVMLSHTTQDKHTHNVPDSDDDHHIQSRLLPNLLPISQESTYSTEIPQDEKKNCSVETSSVTRDAMPTPVVTHPAYEMYSGRDHAPSHSVVSGGKPSHSSSSIWSGNDRPPLTRTDAWETPTSLISRLTAGLTACSSQSQQHGEKASSRGSCPSPSMSEESDSLSFICLEDSTQAEDPFHVAHQELMDEILRGEPHYYNTRATSSSSSSSASANSRPRRRVHKEPSVTSDNSIERSQKHPVHEIVSPDLMCLDSNLSKESDVDECSNNSKYSERSNHIPDLTTLLKSIKQPTLIPYVPDKSNIHDFLDPEEIGHINHLIKSLSDSVLTISLPDTLYNNKGFTPLDYMDIHLNAVMRQFFFVFKNEDFLNLPITDQISLLNGCSLRAVICSGLYLFSKDTGCWYIPGSTSRLNHPVVHISDLLQVYPQHIVSKMYDLHTTAAKLDFDWSMGVITNCILMYTPIKKIIQEMEKVDYLRNKYVHLLLKYITWKHGHHNAALIFPELLKILDALLLLVDELSVLTLSLNEEEVMAVEERLSTLTLMQMAPHKSHSSRLKEEIASWSSLKCVNLTEINNRLCMALHLSMIESIRSNTAEYWTASSLLCSSNAVHDDNASVTDKKLPRILSTPEKMHKSDPYKEYSPNYQKENKYIGECSRISGFLAERDLMLLRHFLEDATGRENMSLIENIKEKMDAKQIQLIIKKLCS